MCNWMYSVSVGFWVDYAAFFVLFCHGISVVVEFCAIFNIGKYIYLYSVVALLLCF
jgi:hypothetical protein